MIVLTASITHFKFELVISSGFPLNLFAMLHGQMGINCMYSCQVIACKGRLAKLKKY